jgi:molybdenum cofactor cytidylyltransferase
MTPGADPKPGNPLIFDAALREQWLSGAADLACRRWREEHPERVRWLDTDNRRFLVDIDTPEDLERFAASTGHTMTWPPAFAKEPA